VSLVSRDVFRTIDNNSNHWCGLRSDGSSVSGSLFSENAFGGKAKLPNPDEVHTPDAEAYGNRTACQPREFPNAPATTELPVRIVCSVGGRRRDQDRRHYKAVIVRTGKDYENGNHLVLIKLNLDRSEGLGCEWICAAHLGKNSLVVTCFELIGVIKGYAVTDLLDLAVEAEAGEKAGCRFAREAGHAAQFFVGELHAEGNG
jgi:hypothetical protein